MVHMPGRHRFSVNSTLTTGYTASHDLGHGLTDTDVGSASLSVRIYASYLLRTLEDG